ncbi:MAG: 50S ribosomal protein L24 [Crenarchaeota archaeon]|nr:50S ribosomal protein L24 [Thermoproteota archaeon]MCR8453464.1 50S ribosomal protein L24 [Thermoproteota archaeon]MCR8454891.1 50S ribosomal protein L24 [Thermoproteota archaeon]MCR8462777.1 50S ribosomal protein L24 [Thermoproteota archaeon]MCR8470528.1 50S ribosomal protein L24 [Thermoproteota archaeon]
MSKLTKCDFCGRQIINPATLFIYVLKTGRVLHFCSGKCRKNYLLGRSPRKTLWTLYRRGAKQTKTKESPERAR